MYFQIPKGGGNSVGLSSTSHAGGLGSNHGGGLTQVTPMWWEEI